MMGPTAAEVVWKPSWMDVISCTLPSAPGTGDGARLLFLHSASVSLRQMGHSMLLQHKLAIINVQLRVTTQSQ